MGIYVEVEHSTQKYEQLIAKGGTPANSETKLTDIPEDKVLICVVQNGQFDAAAIILDQREYECWHNIENDDRPRNYLTLDIDLASKLSQRDLKALR